MRNIAFLRLIGEFESEKYLSVLIHRDLIRWMSRLNRLILIFLKSLYYLEILSDKALCVTVVRSLLNDARIYSSSLKISSPLKMAYIRTCVGSLKDRSRKSDLTVMNNDYKIVDKITMVLIVTRLSLRRNIRLFSPCMNKAIVNVHFKTDWSFYLRNILKNLLCASRVLLMHVKMKTSKIAIFSSSLLRFLYGELLFVVWEVYLKNNGEKRALKLAICKYLKKWESMYVVYLHTLQKVYSC